MRLTPEQALARLQPNRAPSKDGKSNIEPLKHIETFGDEDLYVFGNSKGGVLTPALDTLPSIIGTWEGDCDDMPPALKDMLDEYAAEIEWYERYGEEAEKKAATNVITKAKAEPRKSIPAILETKWSQGSPYNDLCVFEGEKCVTGCNAASVAQLMYHWWRKGYSRGCEPTEKYKTKTNGWVIPALPAITVFDFKHMAKTNPKTAEEKKAVQELMMYLGRTFHSDYTPGCTTAKPKEVAKYLKENLRMGSLISYVSASKVGLKTFENYIYNELLQGRPVIVAGWQTSGGGHTFIIDGYDAIQDVYHVNWGWGGSYDGYFKLSALNPKTALAFNSSKVAIIGIQPEYMLGDINGDGEVNITDAMQAMQDAMSGKFSERADVNSDGGVSVTDVQLIIDKILGRIEL